MLLIALHVFLQYNNWAALVSELECLMAVFGPIFNEIMALHHRIKVTWKYYHDMLPIYLLKIGSTYIFVTANARTTVGKTRKAQLEQDGQSRHPMLSGKQ